MGNNFGTGNIFGLRNVKSMIPNNLSPGHPIFGLG